MSEPTIIVPGGGSADGDHVDAAAVHEGAAAVHEQNAGQSAAVADAAARAAVGSAELVADGVAAADVAADDARGAAEASQAGLVAIAEAINAQNAITSQLIEELRASRQPAPRPEPVRKSTPDKAPGPPQKKRGSGFRGLYYGK